MSKSSGIASRIMPPSEQVNCGRIGDVPDTDNGAGTVFVLVAAFAGFGTMWAAYGHAIAHGYRFYSYGDASLLFRTEGGQANE